MTAAIEVHPRPVLSSTLAPPLTRRTLLHLLGAPFLSHATAETPEPDGVHLRLWRQLDDALRQRDQAIVNRDRLEATLVQQFGYPRIQLPTAPGTPPHFAADPFTIDRILSPGHDRLRQRLKAHLQRRRHAWQQAAHVAGLPEALAAEDAAFHAVEQATVALFDTPAITLVAIRLKLVVLLAKHAPSAADRNEALGPTYAVYYLTWIERSPCRLEPSKRPSHPSCPRPELTLCCRCEGPPHGDLIDQYDRPWSKPEWLLSDALVGELPFGSDVLAGEGRKRSALRDPGVRGTVRRQYARPSIRPSGSL